ncbi:exonuclease domain-containing protein [Cyclospora cayetanensis]|uniref:Exonuclease domain-containing protein n=1 Tax=Cyclospora cayetanensis TaxID=88456 RepID=A0A1D3D995_9EIME|nr:exonuclease domain-containing protein [Cyclospora cayetanensis]
MMKKLAPSKSGSAPRKVSSSLAVWIKQGSRGNQRAALRDLQNALLWMYYRQQLHRFPRGESNSAGAVQEPSRPPWLTVQNCHNVGSVVMVVVPYVDSNLLRIYGNCSDDKILAAVPQETKNALETLVGVQTRYSPHPACAEARTPLRKAVHSKMLLRAPRMMQSPHHCSFIENIFSVATTATTSGRIPIEDPAEATGFGPWCDIPPNHAVLDPLWLGNNDEARFDLLYGVDCEMVETALGKQLGRVCIVDCNCKVVVDLLVKPSITVLDYLTRYSGLTKEMLDAATLTLSDVHAHLRQVLPPGAILVGHSLEYDLRALKLVHSRCIDTTVLYPHNRMGLKLSLKRLAQLYLNKQMARKHGHDPKEDAQTAMLLAQKKIRNGPGFAAPLMQLTPLASALRQLQRHPEELCEELSQERKEYPKEQEQPLLHDSSRQTVEGSDSSVDAQDEAVLFLLDSFAHNSPAPLKGARVRDGLANDSEIIRVCKELLQRKSFNTGGSNTAQEACSGDALPVAPMAQPSSEATSNPRASDAHGVASWGVCVLRGYQRLCCRALHASTDQLYDFQDRTRLLLAAEAQLRQQRKGGQTGEEGSAPAAVDCMPVSANEALDTDASGLIPCPKTLFPPVDQNEALFVIYLIDQLLDDLAASLKPQDLLLVVSPCGDAHRYFSLRSLQSALQGDLDESQASGTPGVSFASCVSPLSFSSSCKQAAKEDDFVKPIKWTSVFELELEKAKANFDGPGKGGWCSFIVKQSDAQ